MKLSVNKLSVRTSGSSSNSGGDDSPGRASKVLMSAAKIAEIMQGRRSRSTTPSYETDHRASIVCSAGKINAEVTSQLNNLDAKVDSSLAFLSELRDLVRVCQTQIEQIQIVMPRDSDSERRYRLSTMESPGPHYGSSGPGNLKRPSRRQSVKSEFTKTPSIGTSQKRQMFVNKGTATGSTLTILSTSSSSERIVNYFTRGRKRSKFIENIWEIMNESVAYQRLMRALVLISVFVSLVHTSDEDFLTSSGERSLSFAEVFFDVIFILEISVRFFTCPSRIAFLFSKFNLVDVMGGFVPPICRAIVGFETPGESGEAFSLRTFLLCGVPILRLFKLLRSFAAFHLLLRAFRMAFEALPVLLFTLSILVLSASTLIYMVEPRYNIDSYPRAMWLTIITTSTVGYGDAVPETVAGYIIVSCLTVVSALYMAIPIGIVGNAFSAVWQDRHRLMLIQRARDRLISTGYTAADVPMLFHAFDKDSDGQLNLTEFTAMMLGMEIGIDDDGILAIFRAFDRDSSGTVDDEEFVREIFPESYADIYMQLAKDMIDAEEDASVLEDNCDLEQVVEETLSEKQEATRSDGGEEVSGQAEKDHGGKMDKVPIVGQAEKDHGGKMDKVPIVRTTCAV